MSTWPITLSDVTPQISQDEIPITRRQKMSSGRSRQQAQYTAKNQIHMVSWLFTAAQLEIFQSFVRFTLNGGADAFTVELPFGNSLEVCEARIPEGRYSVRNVGGRWLVTAPLEIETVPVMSEDDFDLFVELDQDLEELEIATNRLHYLVHTTLPDQFPP